MNRSCSRCFTSACWNVPRAEGDLQAKIELALNDVANNRVDDALRAFERLAR